MQQQQTEKQGGRIILGYWDGAWRAQGIRYLMEYLQISYDQILYPYKNNQDEQWFKIEKPKMKNSFPNLPYIIDGDFNLTESTVLYDYLVEKVNRLDLQGKGIDKYVIQEIKSLTRDLYSPMYWATYKEEKEQEKDFQQYIKSKIEYLRDFLGKKQWMMGNYITIADFCVFSVIRQLQASLPKQFQDCFEGDFDEYLQRFEQLSAIAQYIQSDRYIQP